MGRTTFVDTGDKLIEVPWGTIQGEKENNDGSWRFRLIGGPCHDMTIRVYPPCDRIVFPLETPAVYEIHPPMKKAGEWCYLYNPTGDTGKMNETRMIRKIDNGFGSRVSSPGKSKSVTG